MIDLNPIRARLALDNDFRFLARAREDIAALLAEVESLRAEIDHLQSDLEDAKMGYCPMCDVFGGCVHDTEGEE